MTFFSPKHFLTLLLPAALTLLPTAGHAQLNNDSIKSYSQSSATEIQRIRGRIIEFDFNQPQSSIQLDTEIGRWQLLAPSSVQLRRLGWTSSSLFAGEQVEAEIEVQPSNLQQARLLKLTRANGALLITQLAQSNNQGFESAQSGMYSLDRDHADLQATFDHLGLAGISIRFERLTADVLWHSDSPETSIIQVNLDTSSLRSGTAALDDALRTDVFFDALNYPRIQFKSTQIKLLKWGTLQVDGQLEIKGISKPVRLEARLNKQGVNPFTNDTRAGISMQAKINRSDWGMSEYSPMIGDNIELSFQGEFVLSSTNIPTMPGTASGITSDSTGRSNGLSIQPVITSGN